jgi:hypothetical protein
LRQVPRIANGLENFLHKKMSSFQKHSRTPARYPAM